MPLEAPPSILASGIKSVNDALAKLPADTKVAVVGVAQKTAGTPGVAGLYVAWRPDQKWRVDAGVKWVESQGAGVDVQVVFAK